MKFYKTPHPRKEVIINMPIESMDPDLQKPRVYPIDDYGLPGTTQADGSFGGGDSAFMLGILIALDSSKPWADLLPLIWNEEHQVPVRHPDSSKPFGRPNRFSRDQLVTVLCGAVSLKSDNATINKIFEAHEKKWLLRAWNTERNGYDALPHRGGADITGPQVWALWLRYKKPWWARLVLWACDLENLIGSLIWQYKTRTEDLETARKYRITGNHMCISIIAYKYSPTFVSRLSYYLTPFEPMTIRWDAHCRRVQEYSTAELFAAAIKKAGRS